jgi:signal transduction histidine kinase
LNIINNAFAAMKEGGKIDISMREEREEDAVAVTIKDTGHGISREDLPRIFEPFFTTKREGGVGLGLSITYGIVEKLGGRISVESTVGQGTGFTVFLPAKKSVF